MEKHVIWFSGDADSLVGKILNLLRQHPGDVVVADPAPNVLFGLRWKELHFAVKRDAEFGLVIALADDELDLASAEAHLSSFYEGVVRPLADTTGGVACGISFGDKSR
jgi:hypothetical protein